MQDTQEISVDVTPEATTESFDHNDNSLLESMGITEDIIAEATPESEAKPDAKPEARNDKEKLAESPDALDAEDIFKKLTEGSDEVENDEENSEEEASETEDLKELTHNGEVKKVSTKEYSELAQKGFDYTQKTQQLAEERKEWEKTLQDEKAQLEESTKLKTEEIEQYNNITREKQVWDYVINNIEKEDPGLYTEIQEHVNKSSAQFNNPLVNTELDRMRKELDELKGMSQKQEDQVVIQSFEKEFGETKSKMSPVADKLGLKPDWDKVKLAWQRGAENIEKAFYAVHGPEMQKLYESKTKLSQTQKKAASRKSVSNIGNMPTGKDAASADLDLKKMGYIDLAQKFAYGELGI